MILLLVMIISLLSLVYAGLLARHVLRQDMGPSSMQSIASAIREGAEAFLSRQYKTVSILAVSLAVIIFVVYSITKGWDLGLRMSVGFIFGAFSSGLSGYLGMQIAIRSNVRTAAAVTTSLNKALKIAIRGGAVSGVTIVALSLLGVGLLFYLFGGLENPRQVPFLIVGYAFGASFVALFAQLGGGIFTKAADVGADLVGKLEAGIPEDDPRNPAVIADLVGDNVGDCAGRGADLFESTAAENIGAMILGVALFPHFGIKGILFPLVARAFGLIATMVGVMTVSTKEDGDPMAALNRGYYVTAALSIIGFYFATDWLLGNIWFFWAGLIGIITSILIIYITQYYTESKFRPVKDIARSSQTGPATNIITGFAVALECTAMPVIVLGAALILSYYTGLKSGLTDAGGNLVGGLYGTATATMGMLATCAYILAMDTFGPITDNAGGS